MRSSRRVFLYCVGAAVTLPTTFARAAQLSSADAWQKASDIARNVRAPTFADRLFDITKFGARRDAATLNTKSIAAAIDACSRAGGGRVLVPAGRFLTGAIHLKSDVDLHVSEGATLLFDT